MIAIDPGPEKSAVAVLHDPRRLFTAFILPNVEVLKYVAESHQPLAIEMIMSYGMPVGRETFETCVWIGRFIQAHRAQHRLLGRKEVVTWICADPRGKDANVRQAIIDRLGPVGTKKNQGPLYGVNKDMWSAIAIGITALETRGTWQS